MLSPLRLVLILAATIDVAFATVDPTKDAKNLLDAAIAEVTAVGHDVAAKKFVTESKWRHGSTYIVLVDFNGKILAHSANPKMVGKVMLEAQDASGKQFVKQCVENVKATGESLIDLRWGSPVTRKIAAAQMIAKRVPGHEMYLGVLIFK